MAARPYFVYILYNQYRLNILLLLHIFHDIYEDLSIVYGENKMSKIMYFVIL